MKSRLLPLLLALLLLLSSCTAEPALLLPERSYPITLTAALTTESQKIEGTLTVEESGKATLTVTSPSTLSGFTFTAGDSPTVTHGSITAPLPAALPALEAIASILTLNSTSVLTAEPITLGGMSYNRVICAADEGEATFYLTREGSFIRAEYNGITLDVYDL